MTFTLKDYQESAYREVEKALRRAWRDHTDDSSELFAVTLAAPTGAGKTVIASAVIESLFNGSDAASPDPNATILWVTDDPSLNEQTKDKILDASGLGPGELITIDSAFDQPMLDAGRVFFLNIQKLARTNPLSKSGINGRTYSMWQTISNTIADQGHHLIVIIDEAHRGMRSEGDRETIVSRILNGQDGRAPAPVVWGISATPHRFDVAMAERNTKKVTVQIEDVRASGLLKDLIVLDNPASAQPAGDTTLVRAGVEQTLKFEQNWAEYAEVQKEAPVLPVLVIQVGNTPTDAEMEELLDAVFGAWPGLKDRNVVNAFGEHAALSIGSHVVRYSPPQDIQDDNEIRVVICKDAISTGWDCPRAEVLVSFRRAEDHTYITQLIGRIVRTPLARRIVGDKILNTVNVFLPNFNKDQVEGIVESFANGRNDEPPVTAIIRPVYIERNRALPEDLFDLLAKVPTYIVPGKVYRTQVSRLFRLAALLAGDKILEDAINQARVQLVGTLVAHRARLESDGTFAHGLAQIKSLKVERSVALLAAESFGDLSTLVESYEMPLDANNVEDLFRVAKRKLPEGLAIAYWNRVIDDQGNGWDPLEAKAEVAVMALQPEVVAGVEAAAEAIVREWLRVHHSSISKLSDVRRAQYEPIRREARDSELSVLSPPHNDLVRAVDQKWHSHLLSDENDEFPLELKGWERAVLENELASGAVVGWYRNPVGGEGSVRIPYPGDHHDLALYPDFVFFHETVDGVKPSILDPHAYSYQDAAAKLKGLARYAEEHGEMFVRIESIIEDPDGQLLGLDMKSASVREAVEAITGENVLGVYKKHGGYIA